MENKTATFIYVLIAIIVVYYIYTRYIWCEEELENFDPSLVPVSSIVTLAKVAQKLVDGNGTLTNPGNLTVTGALTAKRITISNSGEEFGSNLTLTAGSRESAFINFNNNLGVRNTYIQGNLNEIFVPSNLTVSGRMSVASDLKSNFGINGNSVTIGPQYELPEAAGNIDNSSIQVSTINSKSTQDVKGNWINWPLKLFSTTGTVYVGRSDNQNALLVNGSINIPYYQTRITETGVTNGFANNIPEIGTICSLNRIFFQGASYNNATKIQTDNNIMGVLIGTDNSGNLAISNGNGNSSGNTGGIVTGGNISTTGSVTCKNLTISNTGEEFGRNLILTAGSKESAFIDFNNNLGVRNTYIQGNLNEVFVSKKFKTGGDITMTTGSITQTATLTQTNIFYLKAVIDLSFQHPASLRAVKLCTPTNPVVFTNGTPDAAFIFPFANEAQIPNLSSVSGLYFDGSGQDKTNFPIFNVLKYANDCFDFVWVYPGYGVDAWTSWDYKNDNNELSNNAYTYKNTNNFIICYRLENGQSNADDSFAKYGVSLANLGAPGAFSGNPVNRISSLKVYKLP